MCPHWTRADFLFCNHLRWPLTIFLFPLPMWLGSTVGLCFKSLMNNIVRFVFSYLRNVTRLIAVLTQDIDSFSLSMTRLDYWNARSPGLPSAIQISHPTNTAAHAPIAGPPHHSASKSPLQRFGTSQQIEQTQLVIGDPPQVERSRGLHSNLTWSLLRLLLLLALG